MYILTDVFVDIVKFMCGRCCVCRRKGLSLQARSDGEAELGCMINEKRSCMWLRCKSFKCCIECLVDVAKCLISNILPPQPTSHTY